MLFHFPCFSGLAALGNESITVVVDAVCFLGSALPSAPCCRPAFVSPLFPTKASAGRSQCTGFLLFLEQVEHSLTSSCWPFPGLVLERRFSSSPRRPLVQSGCWIPSWHLPNTTLRLSDIRRSPRRVLLAFECFQVWVKGRRPLGLLRTEGGQSVLGLSSWRSPSFAG